MLSVIDLSEINNDETANTPELGNLQYHYKTLLDLQKTLSQQDSESGYSLILYKDELEKNISRPMDKKQALKILSSRIARYLQEDKDVIQFNNKDEIILYDYESFDIEKRKTSLDNFVLSAKKRLQYFEDIMDIKFNTMMSIYDCIGYLIRK